MAAQRKSRKSGSEALLTVIAVLVLVGAVTEAHAWGWVAGGVAGLCCLVTVGRIVDGSLRRKPVVRRASQERVTRPKQRKLVSVSMQCAGHLSDLDHPEHGMCKSPKSCGCPCRHTGPAEPEF